MKFSTAVGHLSAVAEAATEGLSLRDSSFGWPLEELWVTGELLDFPSALEWGSVILRIDVPVDEAPWLVRHPAGEWIGSRLRLGKRPFTWVYRPSAWPAWNARDRRVVRFWSAGGGLEIEVIEALQRGDAAALPLVEPADHELAEQLQAELEASRRHLREVLDHFEDREPSRPRIDADDSPADRLWRAAEGVREIEDVLVAIDGRAGGLPAAP